MLLHCYESFANNKVLQDDSSSSFAATTCIGMSFFLEKGHLSLHFTTFGFLTMIFSKSTTKHSGNRRKGGAPAGCVFLVGRGESSFPTGTACNRSLFTKAKEKKRDFDASKWVFSLKWTLTVLGFFESPDNITVANQFYSSTECHRDFIRLSLAYSIFALSYPFEMALCLLLALLHGATAYLNSPSSVSISGSQ